MNRKSFELKFCFLFVSIAFAFFLGLPLANLAYKSLQTGSGTGLGNYAAILTDDAFLTAFRNSFQSPHWKLPLPRLRRLYWLTGCI